jgi:hypothetical protein
MDKSSAKVALNFGNGVGNGTAASPLVIRDLDVEGVLKVIPECRQIELVSSDLFNQVVGVVDLGGIEVHLIGDDVNDPISGCHGVPFTRAHLDRIEL